MGLAKQISTHSCEHIPVRLQWLFTSNGHKFFVSQKFCSDNIVSSPPFTSVGNKTDPMSFVTQVSKICHPKYITFHQIAVLLVLEKSTYLQNHAFIFQVDLRCCN